MDKENIIYKEYVRYVFSYFNHCEAPDQGLFLFRSLETTARAEGKTESDIKILYMVIYNLFDNGYLYPSDDRTSPFVKLTEKGYNYTQGDSIIANEIKLENYVDLSKDTDTIFKQLWAVIGKDQEAPFYVNGPTFFNTIYPFVDSLSSNYSTYMEELKSRKSSTSRVVWFKDLLKKVSYTKMHDFISDLSIAIQKYYDETTLEDNILTTDIHTYDLADSDNNTSTRSIEEVMNKKKVFVTYCWEQDDNNHAPWVHKLAQDLESAGFHVIIDIKQPLGVELNKFMEQTVAGADKVIIIATPEYKNRADNRTRGVGYETTLITDDLIQVEDRIKFIPIIRKGTKETSYPRYLGSRKGLMMRDGDDYTEALKELVSNIENFE